MCIMKPVQSTLGEISKTIAVRSNILPPYSMRREAATPVVDAIISAAVQCKFQQWHILFVQGRIRPRGVQVFPVCPVVG